MTLPRVVVDECCPTPVVVALRGLGFDVRYVAEEAPGLSDTDVLRSAAEEGRILVTTDKDFGMLVVRLGHPVAGLILLRLLRLDTDAVAEKVAIMIRENADKLEGRVTTFTEGRIRQRPILAIRS